MEQEYYQFNRLDRILCCKLFGTWSKDIAIDFADSLVEQSIPFKGEPWARMVDVTEWLTLDDTVYKELENAFIRSISLGTQCLAYVSTTPNHMELIEEIVKRKKAKAKDIPVKIRWFDCSNSALEWLEEEGF